MDLVRSDSSDTELLNRFINLLTSPEPLSLPRQTLLGAISHYISVLPPPDLSRLVSAITSSRHLWDSSKHSRSCREAVKLGVRGALSRLDKEPGSSRWWTRRDPGADWLDAIAGCVRMSDGVGRTHSLAAILRACSRENELVHRHTWKGKQRADVEDEVIMQLAETLQPVNTTGDQVSLDLFGDVAEMIDGEKLRILDLQHCILRQLYTTLATTSHPSVSLIPASQLSRTGARLFEVMFDGDDSLRETAWNEIRQFCVQTRGVIACLPRLDRYEANGAQDSDEKTVFDRHKTALFAFLLPVSKALFFVLSSSSVPPSSIASSSTSASPADLALETLHTLSCFAPIIDRSQGGLETYHRVLYGMSDVLVATGGAAGVRSLLSRAPEAELASPAEGVWWLTLGESLTRFIDECSFPVVIEPLIDKYIQDDFHRASFEAAHSLRLAIVRAAADLHHDRCLMSAESVQLDQQATSQLLAYCELLVQQHIQGKITQDQLIGAYPMVVQAASKYSWTTVHSCLAIIRQHFPDDATASSQTRRLLLIACAPSTPPQQLRAYLEDLARESTTGSFSPSQNDELANAAYRMVLHDLPDSCKIIGTEWWAEWRDRFSGEVKKESSLRARL